MLQPRTNALGACASLEAVGGRRQAAGGRRSSRWHLAPACSCEIAVALASFALVDVVKFHSTFGPANPPCPVEEALATPT